MSDKISEMPLDKLDIVAIIKQHCLSALNNGSGFTFEQEAYMILGAEKCFELMSAAIEEERQASLKSYSDLDDINCDLNWKLKEAGEREAKLKAQLEDVINGKEEPFRYSQYCQQMDYEYNKQIDDLKKKLEKAVQQRNDWLRDATNFFEIDVKYQIDRCDKEIEEAGE